MMLHNNDNNNNKSYADGFDKAMLAKHASSTVPLINGNGVSSPQPDRSPPPKLERITEGSIPISLIVDRVTRKSYAEFLNLAETLPGLANTPRKKKLLDYLVETRRQMIKLLVLVKWARVSKEVDQCIDVVHFLHGQKNCFNNVIIQLQFVRHQLAGARLRNPDLRTAIDVLSTGDYPTFPNQLTNQFIPPPPITPKKALATLKSFNTLLHLRLTLHEVIPLPLSNYTIADGKVTFIVPNEWQLTITISEEFGRWWFVDFRDSNGDSVGEVMKQRVQQVLEEPFEQCKIEYGLFPMGVTEESLRTLKKKAPLVEAYNILHRFHLVHSLSKLYISLHRLSLTPRFSPYIQTATSPNRDTVEFHYWIRGPPQGRNPAPRSHPVKLSIVNEEVDLAFEEAICTVPGGRTALDYERTKIGIRWIRDGVDVPESDLAAIDLTNAEKLVEQVTKIHAQTILERIASETEGLTSWALPEKKEDLYFTLVDSSRRIRISVDLLTGRILLTEMSNTSCMLLPQILQTAQINLTTAILPIQQTGPGQRRPPSTRECISLARLHLLKDHISTLAEYKGWTSQRYTLGYINKPDLDTFLPPQWSWDDLLFLSLGVEIVVIHVVSHQGWLLDLRNLGDGAGLRVVWVEKIADVEFTNDKANWLHWLDTIRFFVRGRYAIYQFEKALEAWGIKCTVAKPPSQKALSLPLLSLKATTLIPEQSSCWAHNNLILRILPGADSIVAVWQGKVRHSTDVEQLLSSVQMTDPLSYSPATKTFTLRFPLSEESTPEHIVSSLIKRFVSVERILQLVRQAKAVEERCNEENVFRLGHFTLAGVECMYGVENTEGELLPVQILVGAQYDIVFRRDDPHERFKAFIPAWYNAGRGDVGILAEYLHATLPLYRELSNFEVQGPEQPSLEQLYNISILPKSTTSVRIYSPQGPYMVDMTLRFFTTEEYMKWMTNVQTEKFHHDKHTVWHITDVALNGEQVDLGDGVCVPLPGLQDVWNRCGSLMGPKAHWVVPLGRGMLCDAQEGGRALKGIWGCVVDALGNPNNMDVSADATTDAMS